MKVSLALYLPITLFATFHTSAATPIDPVTATRNVITECGGNSAQARCDRFLAEYMAYQEHRDSMREQDVAARKARNRPMIEALERQSEITATPKVKGPTQAKFSPRAARWIAENQPRVEGLTHEFPVRFYLDEKGIPYHSSAWPYSHHVSVDTYEIFDSRRDVPEVCTPLVKIHMLHMLRAGSIKCVALDGFTFQPAVTIEGKPIASEVEGMFVLSSLGMDLVIVNAKPILFAAANEPSQAWTELQSAAAAADRKRELREQDQEIRRQESLRRRGF